MTSLELTLLYLLAAVLGVVGCRFLKLPPMLGYLVVGVVIGPNALAFAQNSEGIRHLAEFGVVFLMFVIGLEFNLHKLKAMRHFVFGLGFFQVVLTIFIVTTVSVFLSVMAPTLWGMRWQTALTLAGAMAMSSTAIVIKLMSDRLELDSEHGKRVLGVLLFQDLAVVPLLVLIPALNAPPEQLMTALFFAAAKALVLITLLLTGGQRFMRWWLLLVARRQTEELFALNVLLITLGLAWLTELAGLSLALGAFVAGMLISETEFKHRVEADIKPFHDILLGLFFITIGMMLDWRIIWDRWGFVLFLVTVPVAFKFVLIAALTRMGGATEGISLRTGLYLAQAGEFGFVLLTLAQKTAAQIFPSFERNGLAAISSGFFCITLGNGLLFLCKTRLWWLWNPWGGGDAYIPVAVAFVSLGVTGFFLARIYPEDTGLKLTRWSPEGIVLLFVNLLFLTVNVLFVAQRL